LVHRYQLPRIYTSFGDFRNILRTLTPFLLYVNMIAVWDYPQGWYNLVEIIGEMVVKNLVTRKTYPLCFLGSWVGMRIIPERSTEAWRLGYRSGWIIGVTAPAKPFEPQLIVELVYNKFSDKPNEIRYLYPHQIKLLC
jgi:hypothetical protein